MSWEESRKRFWLYFQQLLHPCARAPNLGPHSPNRVSYAQPRSSATLNPSLCSNAGLNGGGREGGGGAHQDGMLREMT